MAKLRRDSDRTFMADLLTHVFGPLGSWIMLGLYERPS